jgi:hypothetical protein
MGGGGTPQVCAGGSSRGLRDLVWRVGLSFGGWLRPHFRDVVDGVRGAELEVDERDERRPLEVAELRPELDLPLLVVDEDALVGENFSGELPDRRVDLELLLRVALPITATNNSSKFNLGPTPPTPLSLRAPPIPFVTVGPAGLEFGDLADATTIPRIVDADPDDEQALLATQDEGAMRNSAQDNLK